MGYNDTIRDRPRTKKRKRPRAFNATRCPDCWQRLVYDDNHLGDDVIQRHLDDKCAWGVDPEIENESVSEEDEEAARCAAP